MEDKEFLQEGSCCIPLDKRLRSGLRELLDFNNLNIKLKKLNENAVIPSYAHDGDVGMDMTAISVEYDEKYDMYIYHTGLSFESDFNIGQFLFPRSSNRKTDCYLCNSVGIADSAIYRGEIMFCYKSRISTYERANMVALKAFNKSLIEGKSIDECKKDSDLAKERIMEMTKALEFAPYEVGDRVGQMVFMQYPTVSIEEVDNLSETLRGSKGFGSTGK